MDTLTPIEHQNQRVLTTQQIAQAYKTELRRISENFNANKERYTLGKHYYCLESEALKAFKGDYANSVFAENLNKLYLWTEKGALLHAKSLNTDKAWAVYDHLVDSYFNNQNQQNISIDSKMLYQIATQLEIKEKQVYELQTENTQQTQLIDKLQPKAEYTDRVLLAKNAINIREIAADYGLSAHELNKILKKERIQYRSSVQNSTNEYWILYKEHMGKGYTESETYPLDKDGNPYTNMHTKWTQKGRLFIDKILNSKGIYAKPTIKGEKSNDNR